MINGNKRAQDVDWYHYELMGHPVHMHGSETASSASLSATSGVIMHACELICVQVDEDLFV
jgi:hypothetical protein